MKAYSLDFRQRIVDTYFKELTVSVNKPWISRFCPQKEDFFEYVDKTRWSSWRITIWRRLWRKLIPARGKSIDWL